MGIEDCITHLHSNRRDSLLLTNIFSIYLCFAIKALPLIQLHYEYGG